MTKKEMLEYLERYISIYEDMLKENIEKYGESDNINTFVKTRLDTYKDILNDFKQVKKKL